MQPAQPSLIRTAGWPMYRTLVGISVICALIIVTAYQTTLPYISRNQQQALEKAIFQVLPQASAFKAFTPANAPRVYAAFDAQNALVGFAIPAQGMGYQDTIQLLYGYHAKSRTLQGVVILQSRETPGLGSKIESAGFLRNFTKVAVEFNPAGELQSTLQLVKSGGQPHSRQIDAVTGATVSSRAVVDMINRSIAFWGPLLAQQQEITLEH